MRTTATKEAAGCPAAIGEYLTVDLMNGSRSCPGCGGCDLLVLALTFHGTPRHADAGFLNMGLFGFKPKKDEVLNHWIAFVDGFDHSPQEFYAKVEQQLEVRKLPGMEISRVEFAEGGLLSGKRIYLRMIRERLAFDACAAPFGAGYFFSCRTVYVPAVIATWHLVVIALVFTILYLALYPFLGNSLTIVALAGLVLAIAQMFRSTVALGLSNLDATLLKTPVIGPIYERLFRKETYYRADTRLLYLHAVPKIIKELAEETVAAKGVKLSRQYEQAPVLGELYKPLPLEKK